MEGGLALAVKCDVGFQGHYWLAWQEVSLTPGGDGWCGVGQKGNRRGLAFEAVFVRRVERFSRPGFAFHYNCRAVDVKQVEGVGFASKARGDGGAGLNHDGGVGADAEAFGFVGGMGAVFVAGQDDVYAAIEPLLEGQAGPGGFWRLLPGSGDVERVVDDQDFADSVRAAVEFMANRFDLFVADATVLESERPGGVDADDGDGAVFEMRVEVRGDEALVAGEGIADEAPVDGDVVVAGDDQAGERERIQKIAGCLEFFDFSALGEIAGDGEELGFGAAQGGAEGFQHRFVDGAEVEVREVGDGGHWGERGGDRTRSPPGWMR